MPMRGAAVNLTLAPSFPYLHFATSNLKRAADGFTGICQGIPCGRRRTGAGRGNLRRGGLLFLRPGLSGNGLRADELDSALLQRSGRVVKVLCRLAHIRGKALHRSRSIKAHFRHLDRLESTNRLHMSPTPSPLPCPLKTSVITFVYCLIEEAALGIIDENCTTRSE